MDILQFVFPFTNQYLSCSQFLTITNKAAVNIHVKIFVWTHFYFFWVNRSDIAGSYDALYICLTLYETIPFYTFTHAMYESSSCPTSSPILYCQVCDK